MVKNIPTGLYGVLGNVIHEQMRQNVTITMVFVQLELLERESFEPTYSLPIMYMYVLYVLHTISYYFLCHIFLTRLTIVTKISDKYMYVSLIK